MQIGTFQACHERFFVKSFSPARTGKGRRQASYGGPWLLDVARVCCSSPGKDRLIIRNGIPVESVGRWLMLDAM